MRKVLVFLILACLPVQSADRKQQPTRWIVLGKVKATIKDGGFKYYLLINPAGDLRPEVSIQVEVTERRFNKHELRDAFVPQNEKITLPPTLVPQKPKDK